MDIEGLKGFNLQVRHLVSWRLSFSLRGSALPSRPFPLHLNGNTPPVIINFFQDLEVRLNLD